MAELQDAYVALITAVVQREKYITDGQWFTDALIRYEAAVRAEERGKAEENGRNTGRAQERTEIIRWLNSLGYTCLADRLMAEEHWIAYFERGGAQSNG